MGQLTETFNEQEIKKMKIYYESCLQKSPPGAIFRARTNDAVITAYRSGKVLFQGANPHIEADRWSKQQSGIKTKKASPIIKAHTSHEPPNSLFNSSHIGSDESGTGDYFGPVTACAVYVSKEQIETLQKMGIQDSKAIADKTIHLLAKEIINMKIPYSLMVIANEKYNELQANGWTQGKMKTMIHYAVINRLLGKIGNSPYEGILIDQFCNPSVYIKHLASEKKVLPEKSYFMTKAESHSIAVATGSVLARASFLNEMDRISTQVGMPILKGASQKVDEQIAHIITTKGRNFLPKIAKVHFVNTKKAEKYL